MDTYYIDTNLTIEQEYNYQIPYGVVQMDKYLIKSLKEKTVKRCLINAGIYVVSPKIKGFLKKKEYKDMTDLISKVVRV